jgi:choline-glycine betaine transporter
MAAYASPQPLWKRNTTAILDFILVTAVFGVLLYQFFPDHQVLANAAGARTEKFGLSPWATLTLIALVIAYFVVLGRTGGTVFQRLFGMKRIR